MPIALSLDCLKACLPILKKWMSRFSLRKENAFGKSAFATLDED